MASGGFGKVVQAVADPLTKNLRKGFKGGLSIYLAMAVNIITGFAVSVILVRTLSQEHYGAFKLIASILIVGTYFCSLGLEKTLQRYGAEFIAKGNFHGLLQLLAGSCVIRCSVIIFFSAGLLFFQKPIANTFNLSPEIVRLLPLICVILFFSCMNSLWGSAFLGTRLDQPSDSINKIAVNIFTVTGYSYIIWMGFGLTGILFVWVGVQVFSTIYYGMVNLKWFQGIGAELHAHFYESIWQKGFVKRVSRFSFFSFLGINVRVFKDIAVDNLIIAHYLDAQQVALYALAATLVTFVAGLNPAGKLRSVFLPIIVARYVRTNNNAELIWGHLLLTKLVIFFMLPIFIVLILLSDKIIGLVYSVDYLDAVAPMICLCSFFFFTGLTYPFNPILSTLENWRFLLLLASFLSII